MADSVYNPNTASLETSFSQIKETRLTTKFEEIENTVVGDIAQQQQITPRQVRTGETRGDTQLRGLIKAEDRSGRIVAMFGYSQGAF
jgi:hypothetical protein